VYHTAAYDKQLLPVQVPPLFIQFWQLAQAADVPVYPNVSHPGVPQTFGGGVTAMIGGVTAMIGGVTAIIGGVTAMIGGVTAMIGGVTAIIGGVTAIIGGGVTAIIGGVTAIIGGGGGGGGATGVKELLAAELSES
jgi:hypothetical protein